MRQLRHLHVNLPRWIATMYVVIAAGLVPWIVVLSYTLPERHLTRHWDLAWVGFDTGMLLAIALTAVLALRRSWWVCLSAMSVFTFLLVDAWFDVLTSRSGPQLRDAVLLALIVELPLAVTSLWLSYRVAKELVATK